MKMLTILAAMFIFLAIPFGTTRAQGQDFQDVFDAGLGQKFNLSQTIGSTTTTLDWAYVDANNLVVQYTTLGGSNSTPDTITLTDDDGYSFSMFMALPIQNRGNSQPLVLTQRAVFYNQALRQNEVVNDYFRTRFAQLPKTIHLTLNVVVGGQSDIRGAKAPASAVGTFVFRFDVPIASMLDLAPNQSVSTNKLSMTLTYVVITPTQTHLGLCYDLPDEGDWQADVALDLNGSKGRLLSWGMVSKNEAENSIQRCYNFAFGLSTVHVSGTLNITVNSLKTSISEDPQNAYKIKNYLAKRGVEVTISTDHGISINPVKVPDGIDFNKILNDAYDSIRKAVNGPWHFTVEIPATN
jgi:hypothetical protein